MTTLDLLVAGQDQFLKTYALVGDQDWDRSTPCDGRRVRDLVAHLVSAERMAVALLQGASVEEARAFFHSVLPDGDLRDELPAAFSASRAAFATPGALDVLVHHPMGDMPGSRLADFRVGDTTLHAWDLARALGVDETLDPELVAVVWSQLEPLSPVISTFGIFGDGPSGSLGPDDALQRRLLDLTGRRP